MAKRLEQKSQYADYDLDDDGVVSDTEIDRAREIREFEDQSRKHMAQLRIARSAMIGGAVFTVALFMPFIPDTRIELLKEVSDVFFITIAGIVGSYMGVSAWMSRK
jgi:hypothetical protein|tara:strand:- start:3490 stop:3807 length:318 start_codon:yes stop_codon:yes gene_type:complete